MADFGGFNPRDFDPGWNGVRSGDTNWNTRPSPLSQFDSEHNTAAMAIQTMETWMPDLTQAVRKASTLEEVEEIRKALRPFSMQILLLQDAAAEKCDRILKRRA